MTIKGIILNYIRPRREISSHEIEIDLPRYGQNVYMKRYNPASYSRAWRSIRSNRQYRNIGIREIVETTQNRETVWKLVRN